MNRYKKKVYFPNLTSLRGVAAVSVIISHIIQIISRKYNIPNNYHQIGGIAVTFFFVLSGFLITYLLLHEKHNNDSINIKRFYIRRILRIWPLYFFLIGISLFIFKDDIINNLFYFLFFFPTIPFVKWEIPSPINPIWSIGVEEQFYLFFPLIFKLFKSKKTIYIFSILLFSYTSLKVVIKLLPDIKIIRDFVYYERFDTMLLGAIGAFILFYKKTIIINFLFSSSTQYITYFILLLYLLLITFFYIPTIHILLSLLFIIIILNLAANKKSILTLDNYYLNFLGSISYGLYLYHKIPLEYISEFISKFNLSTINFSIIISIMTLCISIILAYLLHIFIEKPFLTLKKRFVST